MKNKQLSKPGNLVIICTLLTLGCLFHSESAYTQDGTGIEIFIEETDQKHDQSQIADQDSENISNCMEIKDVWKETISIGLSLHKASNVSISLADLRGRIIHQSLNSIHLSPGYCLLKFPLSGVRRGAYILLTDVDGYVHTRIIKIPK